MRGTLIRLTAAAPLALVLFAVGCGKKDSSLVTVNGKQVSMDEYHRYLALKPTVNLIQPNGAIVRGQVMGSLGFQALEDLIRRELILQIAQEDGVLPTQQDIEKELEFRKKRNPTFVKTLHENGYTLDMIRERIQSELAEEWLITKGVKVTDQEVDRYVTNNPQRFMNPALVDMKWLWVTSKEDMTKVDQALDGGQMFAIVAQRYSKDPSVRENNAQFPQRVLASFSPQLQKIVNETGELKTTEWIDDPAEKRFIKFYVEKKTPEKKMEINDTLREELRRALALERGNAGTDLNKRILEKLKKSEIQVQDETLKGFWSSAFKKLSGAPDEASEEENQTEANQEAADAP